MMRATAAGRLGTGSPASPSPSRKGGSPAAARSRASRRSSSNSAVRQNSRSMILRWAGPFTRTELDEVVFERRLVLQILLRSATLHAVERGLRDEEVTRVDDLLIVPVKEREQQCANVRPIDVRVAHEDDRVVAELREILVIFAYTRTERRDEESDLLRREHLVEARLLDVQDLSTQRQDRLVLASATLLGRPAGRVTLDDEELRERRVPFLAVGELPRQAAAVE